MSVHNTSQGRIRYRRWQGWITVELADDPTAVLALVRVPDGVENRGFS
jgi:hypothetical protein